MSVRIAPPGLPGKAPPTLLLIVGLPAIVAELSTSFAEPVTLRAWGAPGFFTTRERPRTIWSAAPAQPASIMDSAAASADNLAIRFMFPSWRTDFALPSQRVVALQG